jgi:hypothetical protein
MMGSKYVALNWEPIERAPPQTMLLVGHEAYRGWFEVAEYMVTVGWVKRSTQTKLDREPTHFVRLEPPRRLRSRPDRAIRQ